MDLDKMIEKAVKWIMQDMAYKLSDLCDSYAEAGTVFFLAAEQLHIRAILPLLSEADQHLFEAITAKAGTTVLPFAFDPRKRGGDG